MNIGHDKAMRSAIRLGVMGAFLFFLYMATMAGLRALQKTGQWNPLISFVPETLDLGNVRTESELRCEFRVRNMGNQPLEIKRIRLGCSSCLKILVSPEGPIPPQGEADLVILYSTKKISGSLTRTVAVESNDPTQPKYIIKIHADVVSH